MRVYFNGNESDKVLPDTSGNADLPGEQRIGNDEIRLSQFVIPAMSGLFNAQLSVLCTVSLKGHLHILNSRLGNGKGRLQKAELAALA